MLKVMGSWLADKETESKLKFCGKPTGQNRPVDVGEVSCRTCSFFSWVGMGNHRLAELGHVCCRAASP